MGNYNPSAPIVLGQEWVPIRDENVLYVPAVNLVEYGHGFTLAQSRTLQDVRFYLNELPGGSAAGQTFLAAIYPAGSEALSGPVQRVVIPVNSVGVTGNTSIIGGGTAADAVADPSDSRHISGYWGGTSPIPAKLMLFFAVNNYAAQLSGKRILGVNLLYSIASLASFPPGGNTIAAAIRTDNAAQLVVYGSNQNASFPIDDGADIGTVLTGGPVRRLPLGEIDAFWSTSLSPFLTTERAPWTYTGLQRLEATSANRRGVYILDSSSAGTALQTGFHYFALEVIYCEEQRLAVGARAFGYSPSAYPLRYQPYAYNTNTVPMRTVAGALNPVLPAGAYTVVLSSANLGGEQSGDASVAVVDTEYPSLNALRQLYPITPHPGVRIDLPFPTDNTALGKTFTQSTTQVLPHLSVHTTGGPLTEVHVYGRQAAAPIYGSVTATQDIDDDPAGPGGAQYGQIRFWARRFGNTTIPLTVRSVAVTGTSASITPTEFDALDPIVDGWKQVTLALSGPATLVSGGGDSAWRWSATGEAIGSRWEILAASAPATTGVGAAVTTVPSPHTLGSPTYGAPNAGTTVALSWQSPAATGVAEDSTTDAAVILSQTPATITGLSLTTASQTITGIGLNCGSPPGCIPTGIGYHRITWSASSIPATGFGAYELQRYDTVDGQWRTIMSATSVAVTGFNDYEPRIGVESRYRIRALNLYDFPGAWSSEVAATLATPGVFGSECADSLLIFTSNEDQTGGRNLAYVMSWDTRDPVEQFDYREASWPVLQRMYGRDYQIAYRPTERGGVAFSRTIVVQNGLVSPATLEQGIRSLRDLAWADLSYLCVRTETGDRWLATVIVPEGAISGGRRIQLAQVDIIETTATPSPVDPAA
jgi:hypothetical protein